MCYGSLHPHPRNDRRHVPRGRAHGEAARPKNSTDGGDAHAIRNGVALAVKRRPQSSKLVHQERAAIAAQARTSARERGFYPAQQRPITAPRGIPAATPPPARRHEAGRRFDRCPQQRSGRRFRSRCKPVDHSRPYPLTVLRPPLKFAPRGRNGTAVVVHWGAEEIQFPDLAVAAVFLMLVLLPVSPAS
jgi:hypothetical protein